MFHGEQYISLDMFHVEHVRFENAMFHVEQSYN